MPPEKLENIKSDNMNNMNTILTARGKLKIADQGYMYHFEKTSRDGSKKFWRCGHRRSEHCAARLHTDAEGTVLQRVREHNHDSDAALVEVTKIKAGIKRRATETLDVGFMPSQILNNALLDTDEAIRGKMPTKEAVRKIIQRARNTTSVPPAPPDLQSLTIPDEYKFYETAAGQRESFFLADVVGGVGQRILIFGRESNSTWSEQMETVFVDGAFKFTSPLFSQVYAILAERDGFVTPVLFGLLPNREQETYNSFFAALRVIWPLLNPSTIGMDFEKGPMNALKAAFPKARLRGCLFLLAQNLRKQVTDAGLLSRYDNDPAFSLQARMITSLAYVPIPQLDDCFEALSNALVPCDQTAPAGELEPVLNWFEDNFLGRPNRNGSRQPATFPPEVWSAHESVLSDDMRVMHLAETTHRRLQAKLDMGHNSIWKFIDCLRNIQKSNDQFYEMNARGDTSLTKRRKFTVSDQKIRKLVQDFHNGDVIEFLRNCALGN